MKKAVVSLAGMLFLFFSGKQVYAQSTDVAVCFTNDSVQLIESVQQLSFDSTRIFILQTNGNLVNFTLTDIHKLKLNYKEGGGQTPGESVADIRKTGMYIYPNPTDGKVYISAAVKHTADIRIYTAGGQEVERFRQETDEPVDVTHLPKGFYLMKIDNSTFKFVRL